VRERFCEFVIWLYLSVNFHHVAIAGWDLMAGEEMEVIKSEIMARWERLNLSYHIRLME
jgi:hypothetical protein